MAEYGPFSLAGDQQSGAGLDSAVAALRQRYPDLLGLTSYAGVPGSLSALGFSSPRADLFPGQQPSSLNQLLSAPGAVGQTTAPPESVTAALAQSGYPGGGAVTPTGDAGGGTGGMAPGIADPGNAFDAHGGFGGFLSTVQGNTPSGMLSEAALNSAGVNPTGPAFGVPGAPVSNQGLMSGMLNTQLGNVGSFLNQAIGLGKTIYGTPPTLNTSENQITNVAANPTGFSSTPAQNATTTALGLAGPAGAFGNVGFAFNGGFVGPATGRSDTPEAAPNAEADAAAAAAAQADAQAGQTQGQASGSDGGASK